jgi:hypothetical protein
MISASQQNREAIRMASPDQGVIAGGITKVNTVDNYISIFMDPAMRVQGDMIIYFLKTRSSSAVGTSKQLKFNADNLQITDTGSVPVRDIMAIPSKKNKLKMAVTGEELGLPGSVSADDHTSDDTMEDNDGQAILSYATPVKTPATTPAIPQEDDLPPWEPEEKPVKTVPKTIKKKLSNDNPLELLMQSFAHTK